MKTSLIILDTTARLAGRAALQERSGLLDRVQRLGPTVCWGPSVGGLPAFSSMDALRPRLGGVAAAVLVDGDQIFLDAALAARGLSRFRPDREDLFTQWEHCRLPVGVGVRAVATRVIPELGGERPADWLAAIRDAPAGRRFHYDTVHRVPFAESLLDARDRPALRAALAERDPVSWDLEGFCSLATDRATDPTPCMDALAYSPQPAPRVDERGMPAAYGFESLACARFPTYVMFDITNLCNARCVHCPQSLVEDDGGRPAFLGEIGHLTLSAFKRVIDECVGRPMQFVRITADGEPLVNKAVFEMIEYASEKGVGPVGLTTNGSLLSEKRAQRLVESGVAIVDFSLDAALPETFHAIRVGLDFERTRRNVQRFIDLRDRSGADIQVMVSFVKQDGNHDEVDAFRAYWEPRVDKVLIREMISNIGLNERSAHLWPGWDARWPCAHFFRRVVINHEGILKACPIDWRQETSNLPVAAQSIYEQWHGEFYWAHRMQHLNDAIAPSSACAECPDWAGTPWSLGYEKVIARLRAADSSD